MNFKYYKAGRWAQRYEYKTLLPPPVNQGWTWKYPGINTPLEEAARAIGELKVFLLIVPDVDLIRGKRRLILHFGRFM
jgi:hypothetical protein